MFDFDNINPDKIDFSMYHPIDHSILKCKGYPGGIRTHLDYAWKFKWERDIRGHTLCKIGRHRFVVWYRKRPVESVFEACSDCGKRKNDDRNA